MIPKDLLYSESHEWADIDEEKATVGITHFAQEQLGDLTFVELPEIGRVYGHGEEVGSVESVKAASEIYMPVSGEVIEVNEALEDNPGLVNDDPYGDGWMFKVRLTEEPEGLMDADAYERLLAEQGE